VLLLCKRAEAIQVFVEDFCTRDDLELDFQGPQWNRTKLIACDFREILSGAKNCLRRDAALADSFKDTLNIHRTIRMMVGELDLIDKRYGKPLKRFEKGLWVTDSAERQRWFTGEIVQREFFSRGIPPTDRAVDALDPACLGADSLNFGSEVC